VLLGERFGNPVDGRVRQEAGVTGLHLVGRQIRVVGGDNRKQSRHRLQQT